MIIVHGLLEKNLNPHYGFAFAGSNTMMGNPVDALQSLNSIASTLSPQEAHLFRVAMAFLVDVPPDRRVASFTRFLDGSLPLAMSVRTSVQQALGLLVDLDADSFHQHLADHSLLNTGCAVGDGSATTATSLSASDGGGSSTTIPETSNGGTTNPASHPEAGSGSSGGTNLATHVPDMIDTNDVHSLPSTMTEIDPH